MRRALRADKRRLAARAARYKRMAAEYDALALDVNIELALVQRQLRSLEGNPSDA